MPHLKRQSSGLGEDAEGDKSDGGWLATLPAVTEKDVESDEKTVELMRRKHVEMLCCPPLPYELLVSPHSSGHLAPTPSSGWDECLEELRFFEGEFGNTVVPRDFPHNSVLPAWVEVQRARYLLQNIGVFSSLTGAQMLVLDELGVCDLSSVPAIESNLVCDKARDDDAHRAMP